MGTVLQNIYSAEIVSLLAKFAEQIIKLYKCGINLYIFKVVFNKYVLIFIIMNIATRIGGQQQNMRPFQMSNKVIL